MAPKLPSPELASADERRAKVDFLAPVMALGRRQVRVGIAIGLAGALMVHGAAAAKGLSALIDLGRFARMTRGALIERLGATYDINMEQAKPPPPQVEEEPEEKPPEAVQPQEPAPVRESDNPYDDPPPAAAEAGKLLTAEPDPNEPVNLTDQGFVTGTGDSYAGGTTASTGTSKKAVHNPNAKGGGKPGGTGTAKAPPAPPPGKSLAKSAGLAGGTSWSDCGFPYEADAEQVDFGLVTLVVTVAPDGRAKSVSIVSDPGHGFGRLARQCAMRKRYTPGLDAAGKTVTKTTPPIRVRFTR
jgi:protein TonB